MANGKVREDKLVLTCMVLGRVYTVVHQSGSNPGYTLSPFYSNYAVDGPFSTQHLEVKKRLFHTKVWCAACSDL